MHELSIAHGIVEVVTQSATAAGAQAVSVVRVAVGRLSGVEAGALEFCYELAVAGTLLEGSTLIIEDVPVAIHCPTCNAERELPGVQRFRCPVCDTASGDIRRGRDLSVTSIEIATPAEANA